MLNIKKSNKHECNGISTASLPDIVFMLLFFFMVTSVVREAKLMVRIKLPDATEVKTLENKSLVRHIYIGKPINTKLNGNLPHVQMDDTYEELNSIGTCIESWRSMMEEPDKQKMIISLKADKETEMGIVIDVKQEIRKVQALKVNYAAFSSDY